MHCVACNICIFNKQKLNINLIIILKPFALLFHPYSLGMRHDTTDNACDPHSHIMSSTLGSGKITWSKCSRDSLNNFLK